ncbi:MAG: CPBP family intramembrane glutamic endopeptidase [Acidobacteriota bacterium]
MTTINAFIKRHPVLVFFALTLAIAWGGIFSVLSSSGTTIEGENSEMMFAIAYLAMLAAPSISGILLTGLVDGRVGLTNFLSRLFKWRVGARWYAGALLTAPLLLLAVLYALSLTSPDFIPRLYATDDKAFLLQFSIIVAILVGFFEELGWTGFAVPALRRRYGVLGTGLILGLFLGVWQFPTVFWVSGGTTGDLPPAIYFPAVLLTWLPTYRVLMVWVYDRTGSTLVAMLMHASLVAFWTMLTPLTIAGMALVTYYLVFTAAMWVVIGVVAAANSVQRSRQPFPRQAA